MSSDSFSGLYNGWQQCKLIVCLFSRPSLHSTNPPPARYLLNFSGCIFPLSKTNKRGNFFQKPVKLARLPIAYTNFCQKPIKLARLSIMYTNLFQKPVKLARLPITYTNFFRKSIKLARLPITYTNFFRKSIKLARLPITYAKRPRYVRITLTCLVCLWTNMTLNKQFTTAAITAI
jgi:hypothetical protein